jgi:hypothetical protein
MARYCKACNEYFHEAAKRCHCGGKVIAWVPKEEKVPWYLRLFDFFADPMPEAANGHKVKQIKTLVHQKIYVFGVTETGRNSTKCKLCSETEIGVLSDCSDEAGVSYRCCLKCLEAIGGRSQLELAAKKSKYARRWMECYDALNVLIKEFPDPSRRPYGEVSLMAEMKTPFLGFEGIETVITKVNARWWTTYDLARINGTEERPSKHT